MNCKNKILVNKISNKRKRSFVDFPVDTGRKRT